MTPSGVYPDTPTPAPRDRDSSIVVGGKIRKSASNLELQTKEDDDVFGNDEIKAAPGSPPASPSLVQTTVTGKASEAISIINRNTSHYHRVRGYNGFVPRNDRGLEPTVHNAQGIFSPDANIFVAKLACPSFCIQWRANIHLVSLTNSLKSSLSRPVTKSSIFMARIICKSSTTRTSSPLLWSSLRLVSSRHQSDPH
jgi:hypothetical protein